MVGDTCPAPPTSWRSPKPHPLVPPRPRGVRLVQYEQYGLVVAVEQHAVPHVPDAPAHPSSAVPGRARGPVVPIPAVPVPPPSFPGVRMVVGPAAAASPSQPAHVQDEAVAEGGCAAQAASPPRPPLRCPRRP